MTEELNCNFKGKMIKLLVEDKVIYLQSESTGKHMIRLGRPLEMKKNVLFSRNKMPKICIEFINAWKKEDIDKVAKMETDKEMIEDIKNDFKLEGYEILE